MARKKVQLAFNPDTMTVSDLKSCANTLRSIMQKYNQLEESRVNDETFVEELYFTVLQYVDSYEVE